jgi:DHA1 family bicyclomycin/chloramphenicol resistance-like MFS transporter
MSFVSIVFLFVPVFAPTVGQGVLVLAGWRAIFFALAAYGLIMCVWVGLRLPETMPPEFRRALSLTKVRDAYAITLRHRVSIGNALAMMLVMGALFGFINSVQQIVFDTFRRPALIGLVFVLVGGTMALSSFLNTRIVEALGTRRVLLAGLIAFAAISGLHLGVAASLGDNLVSFAVLQSLSLACFGLISGNLSARAMQPLGHIAGSASSVQGAITSIGGAAIGLLIGQSYNGTTVPLAAGFFVCAAASLLLALWANRPEPLAAGA